MNAQLPLYGLMLIAGTGIPLMASMNAQLAIRLGNPALATGIVFLVGGLATIPPMIAIGFPSRDTLLQAPPLYYLAGLLVTLYALSITWAGPKIGIGNAIFLVLLAQLFTAAAIDHFGLFGAPQSPVGVRRALGLALMALGVFLARKPLIPT